MLEWLILSGHAADLILGVMGVELIILSVFLTRRGKIRLIPGFLAGLLAGAALILAFRTAVTGGEAWLIGLCLVASFVAHLGEMVLKLSSAQNVDSSTNPDQGRHA
jgi:hypothetical protein